MACRNANDFVFNSDAFVCGHIATIFISPETWNLFHRIRTCLHCAHKCGAHHSLRENDFGHRYVIRYEMPSQASISRGTRSQGLGSND
ncbi:hypothetical protein E4T56_gene4970 [Termitomyces sp. T112]|nr:hypothetical protein E4T56_gene4970 [Termitomyces sp. T112]